MPAFLIGKPIWLRWIDDLWPAKIYPPPPNCTPPEGKKVYVYVFGANSCVWAAYEDIIPHSPRMLIEIRNRNRGCVERSAFLHSVNMFEKYCECIKKTYGFIGLSPKTERIVKRLLKKGFKIVVWGSKRRCDRLALMGAKQANSPSSVILNCDVTFGCVYGNNESRAIMLGTNGIIRGFLDSKVCGMHNKVYVEMAKIDPKTSHDNARYIGKLGHYCESSFLGTNKDAEEGKLVFFTAGDNTAFAKLRSCYRYIGQYNKFVGDQTGRVTTMSYIMDALSDKNCNTLDKAVSLVKKLDLPNSPSIDLQAIFSDEEYKGIFKRITDLKHPEKDSSVSS